MAQVRASTIQKEREEVYAALQYAASFHCSVEAWKDCEEVKPKSKGQWTFVWRKAQMQKMVKVALGRTRHGEESR